MPIRSDFGSRDKIGRDELGANVTLAEGLLVHTVIVEKVPSSGDSIQTRDKSLAQCTLDFRRAVHSRSCRACFDFAPLRSA